MAEVVAGALLSAVLDALIGRLASPEVRDFLGVNNRSVVAELVEKLKVTLLSANALLNDAEDKQVYNAHIKTWVDELNELLSEADDIVDEINTEALRHGGVKGKSFRRWLGRRAIKPKIEKIVARLKLLLDQKDPLGLREGVHSKRLIVRSPAPLIGDSSDVYGRDRDKEAVVELLFSENSTTDEIGGGDKVSVIPIVGMGGVGKTTLAQLVYDDQKVKNHFENRVWVTVSDDFNVFMLAKQVFEGLSGKKSESKELGKLKDEMVAFLCGKKFLLVLDDVWNEQYNLWNAFKSCLTSGANGSKIIVTTRSDTVAIMMGGVQSLPLETLSDEDCWQLFKRHVFRSIHAGVDLEDVGKKIVEKCKGLPLAVMSLAGLLCSVSNKNEWEAVLNSDVWGLHEKGKDEIIPSLWLSYSYLPSHFKRCFAYCSIFPKDYEYDKKRIILLWMAEGLLQGENMEDVGEEYIKTLISRSLFQRSAETESSFVMHDLVHDLATFVSGKGFCVRLNDEDNDLEHSLPNLTNKTRHLLDGASFPEMENFKGLSEAKCLRTLMSWEQDLPDDYPVNCEEVVKKFRCLRVLCLSSPLIKKVTKSIGKLKHLRYLDLSGTEIKRLPDTICTLYNLQTLLLNECGELTELPANMGSLLNLRHLGLSDTCSLKRLPDAVCSLNNLQTLLLNGCEELTELPANMGRLLNLRHLDLSGCEELTELPANMGRLLNLRHLDLSGCEQLTELPANMGSLLNLQHLDLRDTLSLRRMPLSNWNLKGLRTLTKLVLNDEHSGSKIKELKELLDGSFEIVGLENVVNPKDVLEAEFEKKSGITEITLEWSSSRSNLERDRATLDAFKPHVSLKELNIINYGGTELSDWVGDGSFRCLKVLRLRECRQMEVLSCGQMNTPFPSLAILEVVECPKLEITGLPLPSSLENLRIDSEKLMEQRMQWGLLTTPLKLLEIKGCKGLIDTFPEEGLLPTTLKELWINGAPNMKSLNGKAFQHLTSLNQLGILECPKLECLPEQCLPASLTSLHIYKCPKLECLPEQGLPASLTFLGVSGCPQLEARLQRETGQDWHKISHIRSIYIDGKEI